MDYIEHCKEIIKDRDQAMLIYARSIAEVLGIESGGFISLDDMINKVIEKVRYQEQVIKEHKEETSRVIDQLNRGGIITRN